MRLGVIDRIKSDGRNAMATTRTQQGVMIDAARIRELLPLNLFAVFSERDPERRMKTIVANYTEDVIWSSPEVTRGARTRWTDRRVVHAAERVH
jgi:hypothetical protein